MTPEQAKTMAKEIRAVAAQSSEIATKLLSGGNMPEGAGADLKREAEINKESACALLALVCAMIGE